MAAKITLTGVVGKDIEIASRNGKKVATIVVGDNKYNGGDKSVTWYYVQVWEPKEYIANITKGSRVVVFGDLVIKYANNKTYINIISNYVDVLYRPEGESYYDSDGPVISDSDSPF